MFSSLRLIPFRAYLLVFLVILVNSIYFCYKGKYPDDGMILRSENGRWIADQFRHGSPAYNAGVRSGDIIRSIGGGSVEAWLNNNSGLKAGETVIYRIERNGRPLQIRVTMTSYFSEAAGFFWLILILPTMFSIASLYLLWKKPKEKAAWLFFIFLQLFAVNTNALSLHFPEFLSILACNVFLLSGTLLGPVLIHFHLVFPKPASLLRRFTWLPLVFYLAGILIFIPYSIIQYHWAISDLRIGTMYGDMDRIGLTWMALAYTIALLTAIYQLLTSRDTLSRNQQRMVIIGSFFGFFTPVGYALFYHSVNQLNNYILFIMVPHGTGSLIMICCILVAIFRFHIWDMELIIRKALLYLVATAFIILSYLLLIWLVDLIVLKESDLSRFLVLGISVILFLVLRDRLQRFTDLLFHRESYDSATVVSGFETSLAGIYRFDELKEKIAQSIDAIFHFKSFAFNLKKKGLIYDPVFVLGAGSSVEGQEYGIDREFEDRLRKSKVFSPKEITNKPQIFEKINGELVIPMVSGGQPNGFFICGQKRSERIYSRQDIQLLHLLAQRVIALLHTAGLFQKDLDRQLMLERERARISHDMHDDVGASLTRISILSELAKNKAETDKETRQWLEQISSTSRSVTEEMSQIIWALNPKNDTLEGLIAYIRRFVGEYLEPTSVSCRFNLPDCLPDLPLTVEVRRNIYLVVREALHNVVKHSEASEVVIGLTSVGDSLTSPPSPLSFKERGSKGEKSFTISISDNGKGFDPSALEFPGNGLVNMKKRMEETGGRLDLKSVPGEGTMVKLEIP